jgi:hypothetical protein
MNKGTSSRFSRMGVALPRWNHVPLQSFAQAEAEQGVGRFFSPRPNREKKPPLPFPFGKYYQVDTYVESGGSAGGFFSLEVHS